MIIMERLDAFKSDITFYFAEKVICPSTMYQEGGENQ